MSMNLMYETRTQPVVYVEFPFQTPTKLTFEVLKKETTTEKIECVKEYMLHRSFEKEFFDEVVQDMTAKLQDDCFILTYI